MGIDLISNRKLYGLEYVYDDDVSLSADPGLNCGVCLGSLCALHVRTAVA